MPKLRVSAGPSLSSLSVVATNHDTSSPTSITSPHFSGHLSVRIRDFIGDSGSSSVLSDAESGYFNRHSSITWSIAIQGHFKEDASADDVVFGNVFQEPIKDHLPYGTAAAVKAIKYIDPPLQCDLYSDRPYAWSPFLATMNLLNISNSPDTKWSSEDVEEDVTALAEVPKGNVSARRKYFADEGHRKKTVIKPDMLVKADFCNGAIDFNDLSLKIAGIHISLAKYWNGLPVTYVCRNRDGSREYFYVVFEIIDEELIKKLEEKGGKHADIEAPKENGSTESEIPDVD